jgi:hypothetical protein
MPLGRMFLMRASTEPWEYCSMPHPKRSRDQKLRKTASAGSKLRVGATSESEAETALGLTYLYVVAIINLRGGAVW